MDDFFIGWQTEAPRQYVRRSRLFVGLLAVLIPLLVAGIVLGQRDFSASVFEYGQLTELEGVLLLQPAPRLQLDEGSSLLLVGAGKHGAIPYMEKMAALPGSVLDGKRVKLQGSLIFHDGKGLLEITETNGIKVIGPGKDNATSSGIALGFVELCGEIADPKCFFGVMKPGEGKPHRSCAIRCIAGGIPPILKVENRDGQCNYYLLKGEHGEDINAPLLPFVADGVKIQGQLELEGDWYVLKINPSTGIYRERPYWFGKDEMMCSGR